MAEINILIVEDTRDLGRLLQSALATLGADIKVQVVPSAEEALLESPRKRYSLAVVDVRLPGITGFELVSKLRARQKDLKVIVMTGMLDGEYRKQSEDLQVNAFFTKPLEMDDFLNTVQRLLELKVDRPVQENAPASPQGEDRLPELLAGLRQECAAETVTLLDESGHVAASAGSEQTLELEAEGGSWIVSSLSAAQKVWRLVGRGPVRGGQIFSGEKKDLLVMPVGDFGLLVVFPAGRSLLRLAAALESAMAIRDRILSVLTQMGAPVQTLPPFVAPETLSALNEEEPAEPPEAVETEAPVEESGDVEAMAELLTQSKETLKPDDVDAFWANVSEAPGNAAATPDALSYDQARQLGLAPDEGNERSSAQNRHHLDDL
ncbi:response regulator containing CheY-like receiver, AAA-type ATPase, and DNA-binding domains [Longilinea arvoryzae]|uniref:Response regulator containing CheY-like receiver, AAA-type ATPase, and DNA-binding domains n=1 Tax=Longilinea arvoryzae TaxID=360412 RepID=A0A0S7BE38_9CHLR|nr:response regulator [Longilinea arvoryzae]GAP12280.1 response regulator containing CheY-like receiver, AAA-type ATPase, and DNA-binding domains [Longilinea arvoryzae]